MNPKPALPRGKVFPHSLSVFFPAYNDAASLPLLVQSAFEILDRYVTDYELIVVNDGSIDDTQEVAESLCTYYGPRMKVIQHQVNQGYGGAIRTGFSTASKDFIFYTDGDGQYDVGELPMLLDAMEAGIGLVNGYKIQRHDPWHRIVIGSIYNQFARFIFGVRLKDIDCDFRLVRRSVLETFQLTSTSGTVCVELVKGIERSGTMVVQIPVHHYPRLHGRSQFFRLRSLGATLEQLIGLWLRLFVFGSLRRTGTDRAIELSRHRTGRHQSETTSRIK